MESKRTRADPIPETDSIMVRPAATHQYHTQDDQTDDGEDLHGREPEFCLAVRASTEKVDGEDEHETDSHVHRSVSRGIFLSAFLSFRQSSSSSLGTGRARHTHDSPKIQQESDLPQ